MSSVPLLPSLARVVRGLSAIFWGLPLAVLAGARTAMGDGWRWSAGFDFRSLGGGGLIAVLAESLLGCLPALAAVGLVLFGVRQLLRFQSQERVWVAAVERTSVLGLLLLALVPFAHWWARSPDHPFFQRSVALLLITGIAFALALNHLLARLAAMLPDEVFRADTRFFSALNRWLILSLGVFVLLELAQVALADRSPTLLVFAVAAIDEERAWLFIVFALLPLALTMTLVWKAKEAVFASVFRGD